MNAWMTFVFAPLAVVILGACDILGPSDRGSSDITVPFCAAFDTPHWAAVQRDGSTWEWVPVRGRFATFEPSEKLGFAYGFGEVSHVYFLTKRELLEVSCIPVDRDPQLTIHGSTEGLAEGEAFQVSARGFAAVGGRRDTSFSLTIPADAEDVIAWLYRPAPDSIALGIPRRVMARRELSVTPGLTLAPFDFRSPTALPFDSARIQVNNLDEERIVTDNLYVPPGFSMLFFSAVHVAPPPHHYAVPSPLLRSDDYHIFRVHQSFRQLRYYYRRARDTSVSLGPALLEPTLEVLESDSCPRLRGTLPAQAEYSSFVTMEFTAQVFHTDFRTAHVTVTRDYLGQTPSVWDISIPAVRNQNGNCLLPESPVRWSLAAQGNEGRVALQLGGKGLDGEVLRFARNFTSH